MPKIVCIALTPQQRCSLQALHKVEENPKMKDRYRMILLSGQGKSITEIGNIVGKTIWTVSDVRHAFEDEGLKGIALKPQPGNHRKLTRDQRREARRLLKQGSPKTHGFPSAYWSVQWVRELVKEKFSVVYAYPDSYHALLWEAGFSFHLPGKKFREQDPEAVGKWLKDVKKN
jgi:transposase